MRAEFCMTREEIMKQESEEYLFVAENGEVYVVEKDAEAGIVDIRRLGDCEYMKGREFKLTAIRRV